MTAPVRRRITNYGQITEITGRVMANGRRYLCTWMGNGYEVHEERDRGNGETVWYRIPMFINAGPKDTDRWLCKALDRRLREWAEEDANPQSARHYP
jgi:hypothetical protein